MHRPISRGVSSDTLLTNSLGDGSTLTLDFTTGILDPRLTFTRSSNATYINSSGLVEWANANIARQSENCASWSGAQNVTPTSDAATAPNGTQTADQLNMTSGSYRYQTTASTFAVGQPYVGSIWMRTVSGTASVGLRIANTNNGANSATQTCAVTETWQRFNTPAFTLTDTANRAIDIGVDQRSFVGGPNTAANIYVWGLQLQPGTVVGEYLATTTNENYNTPRFDYDPTTLAPRGLLIEGQAVNLALQSNGEAVAWGIGGNRTATYNTTDLVSPENQNNATKLVCGTAGNYAAYAQLITGLTGGATYTVSYWIRGPVGHTPRLYAVNGTVGDVTATSSTGTYNNTGWTRLTQTYTLPAATTQVYVYFMSVGIVTTGDTFYVYGFQIEAGSGASSLIPTGASTGTRNADNCELLNLTTMGFNASAGTIFTDVGTRLNTGSQRNYTFLPASGGNDQIFEGSGVGLNVYTAGSFVAQIGVTSASASKVAAAYATNDFAVSVNGGSAVTDTNGALPTTLTKLTIGGSIINASAYANGCIKQFKYWPTRLPNATLQALTT